MLYRHWSLYDSMWHSQYIATRLGIWKENGQKVSPHTFLFFNGLPGRGVSLTISSL
jgi:cell division control protein 45